MTTAGKMITSTLGADSQLTVELTDHTFPDPTGFQVIIKVEAAPINPSDLAMLFGPADLANAVYTPGKIVAPMPEPAFRAMQGRVGQAMPVGNEGAGTVIAAGPEAMAQALIGQRVVAVPGAIYASHAVADARACGPLPTQFSAEQGAGLFVNPLTALGFVETMKAEGYKGIVHTAAASNLGQMLVKLCAEEGIPLVNIVRSPAQVAILKGIGAEYIVDSTAPDFHGELVKAITATGALLAFDAIGGGKMANQILMAMEQVCAADMAYNRYGSDVHKQVYIYGILDMAPTVINRGYGFAWGVGGWLLTPWLAKQGLEGQMRLRMRVLGGITTTFASSYKAKVGLEEMLTRDVAMAYNAKATGEKYLLVP